MINNDGYAIRVVRTLRGYSRRELARLAVISETRLASIEFGAPAGADELRRVWCALTSETGEEAHAGVQEPR